MSFDNDLRELLHDRATDAGPPSPAPVSLIRRGRRHQIRTVVISTFVASALIAGSVVGLSSLRAGHGSTPLGGGDQRTVTIQNVTMTSPADWTLLDLWPNSQFLTGKPAATGNIQRATQTTYPILELANYDPLLQPDGALATNRFCPSSPPTDGGLLYVSLDVTAAGGLVGAPYTTDSGSLHLDGQPTDGVCGRGYYAYVLGGERWPYFAFAAFGDSASAETRQRIADAWDSHVISEAGSYHPASTFPGYVIASGVIDGRPWNLEDAIDPKGNISMWLLSDIGPNEQLTGPSTFPMQGGPIAPKGTIIRTSRVFWGAAAPSISRVVYRPSDGTQETQGQIVPIAGVDSAPYNAFVLVADANTPGQIVAINANGTETAITAPTQSDVDIKVAESDLRNALVAALTYYPDHSDGFAGFTPDQAVGIEPSLTFNTSATAIAGEVSIRDAQRNSVVLVTATSAGDTLCIAADQSKNHNTTYGTADASTIAECNDPAWP